MRKIENAYRKFCYAKEKTPEEIRRSELLGELIFPETETANLSQN